MDEGLNTRNESKYDGRQDASSRQAQLGNSVVLALVCNPSLFNLEET
jgi:hypothetical protein